MSPQRCRSVLLDQSAFENPLVGLVTFPLVTHVILYSRDVYVQGLSDFYCQNTRFYGKNMTVTHVTVTWPTLYCPVFWLSCFP